MGQCRRNLDSISAGLNLVANSAANPQDTSGAGLYGLKGLVVGDQVELFAATNSCGSFTQLAGAPVDSNFKGVAFAPTCTPEPGSIATAVLGIAALAPGDGGGW